ncbi:MAG TPA: prephenate/arogenate dehydrogenase family protein [Rhodospirillales bacterium]|jgi:cyclohexadieny/prephenate dehydrogenase|nr:prephenate/arogenate dehydrogenase family protein [Rhodospirillales bacterium]
MSGPDNNILFPRIALIGAGLIGSSLARLFRRDGLTGHIAVSARTRETLDIIQELDLADSVSLDAAEAVKDADLVILCVPVSANAAIAEMIGPALKSGAIVTDVGSCKQAVIDDVRPHLPEGVHFVPGHPVAGTEHSGPEAGFAELFEGRWAILTPEADTDFAATEAVAELWRQAGSSVEIMEASHHDQVLAITSHLPQLVAYTIVDTATGLEDHLQGEVVKFSAGGFRDFTRLAASDPVMWRDVCLANKDAILDILGRFTEDLTAVQRAIRRGEADILEETFTRTRAIRRGVIDAKQD